MSNLVGISELKVDGFQGLSLLSPGADFDWVSEAVLTEFQKLYSGVVFVGGFSYADVLDSAKGWAGTIRHNPQLQKQFTDFYQRWLPSLKIVLPCTPRSSSVTFNNLLGSLMESLKYTFDIHVDHNTSRVQCNRLKDKTLKMADLCILRRFKLCILRRFNSSSNVCWACQYICEVIEDSTISQKAIYLGDSIVLLGCSNCPTFFCITAIDLWWYSGKTHGAWEFAMDASWWLC